MNRRELLLAAAAASVVALMPDGVGRTAPVGVEQNPTLDELLQIADMRVIEHRLMREAYWAGDAARGKVCLDRARDYSEQLRQATKTIAPSAVLSRPDWVRASGGHTGYDEPNDRLGQPLINIAIWRDMQAYPEHYVKAEAWAEANDETGQWGWNIGITQMHERPERIERWQRILAGEDVGYLFCTQMHERDWQEWV